MESAASAPLGRSGVFQPPASSVLPLDFGRLRAQVATYLRPEDVGRIEAAYHFAADAHSGQFRISGDPYISHPVAVAEILAGWHLDAQALCAALLHDVMEDTHITKSEIAERFGRTTAELVDGVSKLDKIEFQSQEEAQAENFRKMLLAMASDLRVILIKLADRLHNMRTLDCVRPDKRRRIARETQEIHAPIANRLGLNALYRELQELAFKHVHPMRFRVLSKAILAARGNRREVVGKILAAIEERLPQWNIQAEVRGREKHLYSIYRKMNEKRLSFSQVLDIYGFRVIVPDVQTCYRALGALHGLYKPVPGKFKDYIAIPKANGYQSLHTTLIGPFGTPLEVQIRTAQMNHVADSGVASHWLYKEDEKTLTDLQAKTHTWLQSLLELQSTSGDSSEFLEHVKVDLFPGEVYAFTPKGKIFALPRGATVVDFAYAVHTDVGNRCVAGRVNGELLPLRTELRNGDQVEIITAAHANPNPAWLTYIKTGRARSKIRHFLRTMQNEESASLGERLLNQELLALGVAASMVPDAAWEQLLKSNGNKSRQDVFTDIGLGKRLPSVVARRLLARDDAPAAEGGGALTIRGTEGMAIQLAKCCQPIPGDPIIGSIRKGHGLVIHTHDCPAIRHSRSSEPHKWIDVEWEPDDGALFEVRICVEVKNTRGVLAQVAAAIAEAGSNIEHVSMDASPERLFTDLGFTIQVANRAHLAQVLRGLRHIPEVSRIARDRGGLE